MGIESPAATPASAVVVGVAVAEERTCATNCCGCCCNMRTAVIVVNVISLILAVPLAMLFIGGYVAMNSIDMTEDADLYQNMGMTDAMNNVNMIDADAGIDQNVDLTDADADIYQVIDDEIFNNSANTAEANTDMPQTMPDDRFLEQSVAPNSAVDDWAGAVDDDLVDYDAAYDSIIHDSFIHGFLAIVVVRMICSVLGIYGAVKYKAWPVVVSFVAIHFDFIFNAILFNLLALIGYAFSGYPHAFFLRELKRNKHYGLPTEEVAEDADVVEPLSVQATIV